MTPAELVEFLKQNMLLDVYKSCNELVISIKIWNSDTGHMDTIDTANIDLTDCK